MPNLDAPPVNDNPALQAKLEGANPAPQPPAEPPADPAPVVPPADTPAVSAPAPGDTPPAEPLELPEPDAAPAPAKWEPTGNETLDSIGTLFSEKGVDGGVALEEFQKYGEISQETYDGLVEKLGSAAANLVHNQFKIAAGELKQAAQAEAAKIYETVGGEEAWKQIAAWTKGAALSDSDRAEYNSLLRAGGKAAQLAAKELKERMMADPQFKARADLVGSGGSAVAGGQPAPAEMLDRSTYRERIRTAEQRGDRKEIEAVRQAGLVAMQKNPYWKIGNPKK